MDPSLEAAETPLLTEAGKKNRTCGEWWKEDLEFGIDASHEMLLAFTIDLFLPKSVYFSIYPVSGTSHVGSLPLRRWLQGHKSGGKATVLVYQMEPDLLDYMGIPRPQCAFGKVDPLACWAGKTCVF